MITDMKPREEMPSRTQFPDDTDEIPAVSPEPDRPARSTSASGSDEPKARFTIDLSLSQILGGGLAAATAAAIGSKLGVAGTIGGAAVASVVTAVAASVYTASVRRTRAGVARAFRRRTTVTEAAPVLRQGTADWAIGSATDTLPASPQMAPPTVPSPSTDETASLHQPTLRPRSEPEDPRVGTAAVTADQPVVQTIDAPSRRRWSLRTTWQRVAVGAVAVFVLASVVIFGFEQITGQALDGKKGTTTFSQVTDSGSRTKPYPSSGSSREPSSEPSGSASSEPSASSGSEPSTGASSEPSAGASDQPSSEPSSQPSGTASGQASTDPSGQPSNSTQPSQTRSAAGAAEGSQAGQPDRATRADGGR